MESFVRNASDIQGDPRRWLESGLGQHLQDNQRVMVAILNSGVEPDPQSRREAHEGLRRIRAQAAAHVEAKGHAPEEVDVVVDEAVADVRRKRP